MKLGDFLADEETKAQLRDRGVVGTLSYKESLAGEFITKADAIKNSEDWELMDPDADDEEDDPPIASPSVFASVPPPQAAAAEAGPSSPPPRTPVEAQAATPATTAGCKRKSRAA